MAGEDDPLKSLRSLRQALAALDDAALASLASAGLLRRARKDLEGGETVTVAISEALPLELSVAGCTVRIPAAGPAAATCTCPAPGTCRHILMAVLHLQSTSAEEPPAAPETSSYTFEEIARWAGRKDLREALRLLATAPTLEIEETGPGSATVRFPDFGAECRHLPGAGLEGMITNVAAKVRKRFLAAAVLAWQRSKGLTFEIETAAPAALSEPAGAPRTRAQVIAEARHLFEEMLAVGLSHLSDSFRQRLATLGVSALGANLPRLSLALKGLAGEVELLLRRDARADEARLFLALARTGALCEALGDGKSAPSGLVGEHRTRYEPAGNLELYGLGAWPWRTRSGHGGLTVLFWSPNGHWYTWSESRPKHATGPFKPSERYIAGDLWNGLASPREASRTRFTLMGARVNGEGRLSASESSQAVPLGLSNPLEIGFGSRLFTRFQELRSYLASVHPAGLTERRAGDEIVVIRPAFWGPRGFDPILQVFRWLLIDEEGGLLRLEIPWDETSTPAVKTLESVQPERDSVWGLIGRVSWDGTGLSLSPAVLLRSEEPRIVSLGLDDFRGSASRSGSGEIPAEPQLPWLSRLENTLGRFEEELLHLAEAGRRTFSALPPGLIHAAQDLETRGLPALAAAAKDLAGSESGIPARLLRARYLCELHRQAAVRLAMTGGALEPEGRGDS